jgi:hypothetical protein
MQELVADYLFGTLSDYEKVVFEANIDRFPEIQNEIKEFHSAFDEVNKYAFEEDLVNRSRNLSYKVQQRIDEKRQKRGIFTTLKFLSPALTLLVIIIFAKYFVSDQTLDDVFTFLDIKDKINVGYFSDYGNNNNSDNNLNINSKSNKINLLSQTDLTLLQNEITNEDIIEYSLNYENSLDLANNYLNLNNLRLILNQYNQETNNSNEIENDLSLIELTQMSSGAYNLINFNNSISELDEDDLQYLLNSKF